MSREILFNYAMRFAGVPYKWGGDDPMSGIDCSGLVIELMQSQGLLPRGFDSTAKGIHAFFAAKTVSAPEFGALLFFGKPEISHTAFALSDTLMLEAGGGDSTVVDLKTAEAKNAFVRVRPIAWRHDLAAIVKPEYPWGAL